VLSVEGLTSGYGKKIIVKDVSLKVGGGEIVAIIGHNGSGKSTLLRAVFGFLPILHGAVSIQGIPRRLPPWEMLEHGVAYVPQGNRVFGDLTVKENLEVGRTTARLRGHRDEGLDRIFNSFPILESRQSQRARTLSGGEQQILALANVLLLSPRLLLIDEPSLGLAQSLVKDTLARIRDAAFTLGTSVLIVEQRVREVMQIADHVYVFRNGRVTFSGAVGTLDEVTLKEVYL
jgi:branched-chain amino acid transport system ATP-binding protein